MISSSPIASSASAASYFLEKNGQQKAADGRAEYYSKDQVRSSWGGTGAAYAGLSLGGAVEKQTFVAILDGKVTDFAGERSGSERTLGKVVVDKESGERRIEHRAGWDFTFSAPKSVSTEAEVWGDADVRAAHEAAVQAAMDFLEAHAAQARVGGVLVETGNLVFARFEHSISRDLDPQSHTHVVIANATVVNGVWYSLSNEKLLELRHTADHVYKNELANRLLSQGMTLQWDSKESFEIASYSKADLDVFSKRTAAINEYLTARGVDPTHASYDQRQQATLATRPGSDALNSAEAQRAKWVREAAEAGVTSTPVGRIYAPDARAGASALSRAIAHLTEREAAFSVKDLYKGIASLSEGKASYAQIEAAIKHVLKSGDLVQRVDGKYTTRDMLNAEKDMAKMLAAGRGAHQEIMTDAEFERALREYENRKTEESGKLGKGPIKLSREQVGAARMILTGNDRYQGVQGLPGTGKTTLLEFVREAAEAKGWSVAGFSTGGAQAAKMESESGIRTSTTARHLIDTASRLRDAELASRALATYQRHVGVAPDFTRLNEASKAGGVQKEFDASGRAFYADKSGRTWTPALYHERQLTKSANINHLGLTSTTYVRVADSGVGQLFGATTILKSGGSLTSEAASALRENLRQVTGGSLAKQVSAAPADALLQRAERWRPAGVLESMAVRGKLAIESLAAQRKELTELKAQAASMRPNEGRVLWIMDEASQAGQRQFNEVLRGIAASGVRGVMLGDKGQFQSVEAGRAFERAQDHMPVATLGKESIQRQKFASIEVKDAVNKVLDGKYADAIRAVETREYAETRHAVESKWKERVLEISGKREAGSPLTREDRADEQRYRSEVRAAMRADNVPVVRGLAKDYAALTRERDALPAEKRDEVRMPLVLTGTNLDRRLINEAIRDELKKSGVMEASSETRNVLLKNDRTAEELRKASSYEKGDVLRFTSDYARHGVSKGDEGTVVKTDTQLNSITLALSGGRFTTIQPDKLQGREVFRAEDREFSRGDRVVMTRNDRDLNIRNGDHGTVLGVDGYKLSVRMDSGQAKEIDLGRYRNVDHGYASTSHSAQGQSERTVWKHYNTEAGRHGDRETGVDITRSSGTYRVYTQNADKAAQQAGLRLDKESAHDSLSSKEANQLNSSSALSSRVTGERSGTPDRGDSPARDSGTSLAGRLHTRASDEPGAAGTSSEKREANSTAEPDSRRTDPPEMLQAQHAFARQMIAESFERHFPELFNEQNATEPVDDRSRREIALDESSPKAQMERAYDRLREMMREAYLEKGLIRDDRASVATEASDFVRSARAAVADRSSAREDRQRDRGSKSDTRDQQRQLEDDAGYDR